MNTIIVDLQGFKDSQNAFIVKELAIATGEHTHIFLIKPPYPFTSLNDVERKLVWWIEKNKGYRWSEGYIDYREFRRVIKPFLKDKKIIVKGEEKIKWIQDLCGHNNIKDITYLGLPNLNTLSKLYCGDMFIYHCFSHKKTCALKNVLCVKRWCKDNKISV